MILNGTYEEQKNNIQISTECSETCGKRVRIRSRLCHELNIKGKAHEVFLLIGLLPVVHAVKIVFWYGLYEQWNAYTL